MVIRAAKRILFTKGIVAEIEEPKPLGAMDGIGVETPPSKTAASDEPDA